MVSHWKAIISSSLEELASSSLAEASNEGEGEGAKPAMRAWQRAMRPTWVFVWHISSVR